MLHVNSFTYEILKHNRVQLLTMESLQNVCPLSTVNMSVFVYFLITMLAIKTFALLPPKKEGDHETRLEKPKVSAATLPSIIPWDRLAPLTATGMTSL